MAVIKYVILIIIDALRYDRVTSGVTPFISSIARRGVVFENAFSVTNATDPSLTSIYSGRYPISHGIVNHGDRVSPEEVSSINSVSFIQEILRANGYVTMAIDWLGRWHRRGFTIYKNVELTKRMFIRTISRKTLDSVKNKLRSVLKLILISSKHTTTRSKGSRPRDTPQRHNADKVSLYALRLLRKFIKKHKKIFMFIHYWDTHVPYNAPQDLVEHFLHRYRGGIFESTLEELLADLRGPWKQSLIRMFGKETTIGHILAMYDASARYVDSAIKELIEYLEERKMLDETLVIITSDHGESLIEHNIWFDHHGLYDVSIRVPLIFYGACIPQGEVIRSFVQHVDLFSTLLELLGIKANLYVEGKSLVPLIMGEIDDEIKAIHDFVYAEEAYTERKFMIRDERYKFIMAPTPEQAVCRYCDIVHGGVKELYDLKRDSEEKHNIVKDELDIAKEYERKLRLLLRRLTLGERIRRVTARMKKYEQTG